MSKTIKSEIKKWLKDKVIYFESCAAGDAGCCC